MRARTRFLDGCRPLRTVVDRITAEAVAALDAADPDGGTATGALLGWLDVTWRLFERYPLLLHPAATAVDQAESDRQHAAVVERLEKLIRRGQATGEFDAALSPAWLVAVTIALGHAAGGQVAAGRMSTAETAATLRRSILRVYGAREP